MVIDSKHFASTKFLVISSSAFGIFLKNSRTASMKLPITFSSLFQDIFLKFSPTHTKTVRSFETSGINDLATRCNKPLNLTPYFLPRSLAGQSSQSGTEMQLTVFVISYHLFSYRKTVQDYIIHMDMEIVIFVGIKG